MKNWVVIVPLFFLLSACYKEAVLPGYIKLETPDWSDYTHGGATAPDYDKIFPDDQIQRLDIVIDPVQWTEFWDHLEGTLGPFGQPGIHAPEGTEHSYIPVDVFYEGRQWYKVGLRPKGNSSLKSSWSMGILKLPFKLDFDEFEDQYTGIQDQRFYGFEQLSLKNGFSDPSFIREKIIDQLFEEAGLPSVQAAFYRLYIDKGEGPEYFGLYTLVEDVDDTFVPSYFDQGEGFLYKPEGRGASFSKREFNTADFYQHQEDRVSNYEDIEGLYEILHDTERIENPESWRSALESVFDTDMFIRWLACNTTVQNWDTYGVMWHNYYLYHDPSTDQLVWIHWDNNEALMPGKGINQAPDFGLESITDQFPLIRYIIDDPVYFEQYKGEIRAFIEDVFFPDHFISLMDRYFELIDPYVVGPDGEHQPYTHLMGPQMYAREVNFIHQFALRRYRDAQSFLGL